MDDRDLVRDGLALAWAGPRFPPQRLDTVATRHDVQDVTQAETAATAVLAAMRVRA